MKAKQILTFLKNLVFVPQCGICDERISPIPEREDGITHGKVCLCKSCLEQWEKAKVEMCPVCYNVSSKCTCTPNFFFNYQPEIPSLCFYDSESESAATKMIITMKRRSDPQLFEFVTIELMPKLNKTLDTMGIDGKNCIFTWVPRKRSSIAESGFDQGKLIAVKLASLFDARCLPLFIRTGGKEQKKLDKKSRKRNAEKSIKLNDTMKGFPHNLGADGLDNFLNNKTVIIVDDVLTSGATLRRGVELLSRTSASNIVVACIAKSIKNNKKA